jgi:lipooligosaccharide transport system ATP-binding protein
LSSSARPLVHARGLTKRFPRLTAVDQVDFDVHAGEAFGFLGPNGAGKTSTMKMIGCASPRSDGELLVMDMDPRVEPSRIKARLGVIPQTDNLDTELTVRENLLMYARYFDIARETATRRASELLDFVQLSDRADAEVEPLSGGMKRRLTIARGLINEPDLLLLDEPTTGLDPQARHVIWDRLYRLKRRGVTLLLTTHYMDEAEQLCDRIVVMDKGKIVAEGSPRQLIERYATREVLELRIDGKGGGIDDGIVSRMADLGDRIEALADRLLLYTGDGERALEQVRNRAIPYESAFVRRSTLEDVFLRITGRSLIE